jgi:formylglycine-generating enzyme required for sulfatase activity
VTSKFALVIANTDYQDASFAKLTAPGKDAEEFAQILSGAELAAFEDVQVLLNERESQIRRSIARFFADRRRDDLLLLYFSGHGIRNGQGQLFLAASDTEIAILEATGIPADFITYAMNNSRSQRQLLILDCCNSGAFAHGSKSGSAVGKSMGIASAFEGSGFGRVVLTATDATQFAWEGDQVIGETQKSVFTHFLIEGLKGAADRNGDGCVDVDELYEYAYEQVVRRTPKQTPGKWSYKQQGDIVLRENLKPRDVTPVPLPPELLEMLSHPSSSIRRAAIQDLIGLLDSRHLGLARAAQEKIREIAENDDSLTLRKTANAVLISYGLVLEKPSDPEVAIKEPGKEEKVEDPTRVVPPQSTPSTLSKFPIPTRQENVKYLADLPHKPLEQKKVAFQPIFRLLLALLIVVSVYAFFTLANLNSLTSWFTVTPTPTITVITSRDNDGMILVYVPAGNFIMGSDGGNEQPEHEVYLAAFWIDRTEVTNAMYSKCVQEGACVDPRSIESATRDDYYSNPGYGNFPMINVSWNEAQTYCAWAGRQLPTEAQWEKTARGTDARTYPWGNDAPTNNLLNYNLAVGDTTEVAKFSNGTSPYGAFDMAGNVWEWVADWYSDTYYSNSPSSDPSGPDSGTGRVLRGGAWNNDDIVVRSARRFWADPSSIDNVIGFRCARNPTP